MTAKEYIEERFDTDWTIQISSSDLADLLEAYHKSKVESITDECKWENDEEYEYYETECSGAYTFIDGGVKENKYKYCPNCGRKIKEV